MVVLVVGGVMNGQAFRDCVCLCVHVASAGNRPQRRRRRSRCQFEP